METRDLAENIEAKRYFENVSTLLSIEENEGKRDMGPLYPFIISGGKNTERWYFVHINDITDYKFNIEPKYFADESNYTESFPNRIKKILEKNADVKIFCVFDWDTIYGNPSRIKKHQEFTMQFEKEITNGSVVLCPSMPCVEYWFLLHFNNDVLFCENYAKLAGKLPQEFKSYFSNSKVRLKKLLKQEKYLKDSTWVRNLCSNSKLDEAIKRAENNIKIAIENGNLTDQSYTYIYKIFKQ